MARDLVSFAVFAVISAVIGALVARQTSLKELRFRLDQALPRGR